MITNVGKKIDELFQKLPSLPQDEKIKSIKNLEELIKTEKFNFSNTNLLTNLYKELAGESSQELKDKYLQIIHKVETKNFVTDTYHDFKPQNDTDLKASFLAPDYESYRVLNSSEKPFFHANRIIIYTIIGIIVSGIVFLYYLENVSSKKTVETTNKTHLQNEKTNLYLNNSQNLGILPKAATEIEKVIVEEKDGRTNKRHLTRKEIEPRKALPEKNKGKIKRSLHEKNKPFTEAYPYIGKAISLKNTREEKLDPSDVRYEIKFHPQKGMKLRIRTNVLKKTYIGKKLISHVFGKIYHTEEIVNVFGDAFETKIHVFNKTNSLKDLHHYKFLNLKEHAFSLYSMEGVVKDYRYHGNGEMIWYPLSYNNFTYPRNFVGLKTLWGSTPGESYENSPFTYKIRGFQKFKEKEIIIIDMFGLPSRYKTHVNDEPKRKVPAMIKGFYYLNMESGSIEFFSFTKKYNYRIKDENGLQKRVFFEYNSITY